MYFLLFTDPVFIFRQKRYHKPKQSIQILDSDPRQTYIDPCLNNPVIFKGIVLA